ncbi:MAG: DinB family protein [Caldilineaceae bacterium]|nr:DinB family protein [Caldilineaceae bacterium]
MTVLFAINRLLHQERAIQALAAGVDDEQARWKPTPGEWSILEVINHLYDEEREDFRQRLELTLRQPQADWPPIDPAGWVTARRYNERDLAESLQNFHAERENSLAWLRSLHHPDLTTAKVHPVMGTMRAGDLLAAWVAHDCLHIRQLNELLYLYNAQKAKPYAVEYAGDW